MEGEERPWQKRILSVVIANGRYFGGGIPIAPAANLTDGFFDVIVIEELGFIKAGLAIPLLYSKQLARLPGVMTDRVRKITLHSQEKMDLDIDGELVGSLPAIFEVLPLALEVKCG